jgi:hypothetical protein
MYLIYVIKKNILKNITKITMTVFICKECVFLCNYESDYKRHLKTKKHIKNINNANSGHVSTPGNASKMNKKNSSKKSDKVHKSDVEFLIRDTITNTISHAANIDVDIKSDAASIEECDNDIHECECGKSFKSSSGLRKHKRHMCCTKDNIIMKLIKDNAEMKELMREQQKFMREQQEQYHKQLVEMIPMVCATNNTNLITNNHNHMSIKQKFNLNVFLNEQCKDALNIGDFINSLQITLDDLSVTREKTLEDSVENIFLRGLKELDIYKRPIHCTDHKRDVMYIKDEEKWEKDEGNIKLKDTIGTISRKQIKKLKEWKDSDPEVTKTTSVKNDKFLLTLNHVCTPIPETSEKRLIKNIGKEVQID